jgi:hypothetical protein
MLLRRNYSHLPLLGFSVESLTCTYHPLFRVHPSRREDSDVACYIREQPVICRT